MKKLCLVYSLLFMFVSCGSAGSEKGGGAAAGRFAVSDSVIVNNVLGEDEIEVIIDGEFNIDYDENFSYKGIKIMHSQSYNESEYAAKLMRIMDTIIGIFYVDNEYKIKECMITKVNAFEYDCGGTYLEATLNTNERYSYLIRGLNNFNMQYVDTVAGIDKSMILPNTSKAFEYNKIDYSLRAEGVVAKESIFGYKLYLESNGLSQCIVRMKSFNDSMTEISWIGDIDGDGKPDLIINSPARYENNRIILFLSSFAGDGELVKLVSITCDNFSC